MREIRTIRLENILSFGPGNEPFSLEPLNVLIGPNASWEVEPDRSFVTPRSSA